jgi:site-specific recombinase XerD
VGARHGGRRYRRALLQSHGSQHHTLAELIDRYIADVLPQKSASSIYMQTLQLRWWKRHLGTHRLAELTPALIAKYRDHLAKHDWANSTVNRYLAALSHCLKTAVDEWGWLEDSPTRGVRKPKEPRGRIRFLSDNERERLLSACLQSRSPYVSLSSWHCLPVLVRWKF